MGGNARESDVGGGEEEVKGAEEPKVVKEDGAAVVLSFLFS